MTIMFDMISFVSGEQMFFCTQGIDVWDCLTQRTQNGSRMEKFETEVQTALWERSVM